jgi:hypothetical protein
MTPSSDGGVAGPRMLYERRAPLARRFPPGVKPGEPRTVWIGRLRCRTWRCDRSQRSAARRPAWPARVTARPAPAAPSRPSSPASPARCLPGPVSAAGRAGGRWPAARRRPAAAAPGARSTPALAFPWDLTTSPWIVSTSSRPIVSATVIPPSRTHKNIARGRRFSISRRSRASSLGFSAAVNAGAKNWAFTAGPLTWASDLQTPSRASSRPDRTAATKSW